MTGTTRLTIGAIGVAIGVLLVNGAVLYAVLDEEQRATVERLTKHRHGHHGGYDDDGEMEQKKG